MSDTRLKTAALVAKGNHGVMQHNQLNFTQSDVGFIAINIDGEVFSNSGKRVSSRFGQTLAT